jgi:hypothetical protein
MPPPITSIAEPISRVEGHTANGLELLLEQFKRKPRIAAVLGAFLGSVQELDDVAFQVLTERDLDTAIGVQLDVIGRIVGELRQGRTDDEYRPFLRARILVNRSNGLTEEIITIVRVLLGESAQLTLREEFPAAFTIIVDDAIAAPIDAVIRLLQQAKAAGVRVLLEYSLVDDDEAFTFASGNAPEPSTTQGFGDTANPAIGGALAGVAG